MLEDSTSSILSTSSLLLSVSTLFSVSPFFMSIFNTAQSVFASTLMSCAVQPFQAISIYMLISHVSQLIFTANTMSTVRGVIDFPLPDQKEALRKFKGKHSDVVQFFYCFDLLC